MAARAAAALFAASLAIGGAIGAVLADDITVSGNPGPLLIGSASAGFGLDAATDASTTYSVNVTSGTVKITGSLDAAMPPYTSLKVALSASSGATSTGQIALTTAAQDLVTGISNGTNESGIGISYRFEATVEAGVVSSGSKTVVFTITDNS